MWYELSSVLWYHIHTHTQTYTQKAAGLIARRFPECNTFYIETSNHCVSPHALPPFPLSLSSPPSFLVRLPHYRHPSEALFLRSTPQTSFWSPPVTVVTKETGVLRAGDCHHVDIDSNEVDGRLLPIGRSAEVRRWMVGLRCLSVATFGKREAWAWCALREKCGAIKSR